MLLEVLLYKLVSARLLLAADETRYLAPALREVERAVDVLRTAEDDRRAAVRAVAADVGVDESNVSWAWLVRHAPPAFRVVFDEHRTSFLLLADEIEQVTATNRRLASGAIAELGAALTAFRGDEGGATYDASGNPRQAPLPTRLDRAL